MIDWHAHILPKLDDGCKDVAESISVLKMLGDGGVETVIATPHFHPSSESVESFLKRREASYASLLEKLPSGAPKILLGAEVKYYSGISHFEGLKKLTIGGGKMLLLEMPMSKWTEYTVRDLLKLAATSDVKIVLAHIERYLAFQSGSVWKRLYDAGILMQVNASFFSDFFTRRKALNMLLDGKIHFIGSDCHNASSRAPKLSKAFGVIEKKLGKDLVNQINGYGNAVLAKNI